MAGLSEIKEALSSIQIQLKDLKDQDRKKWDLIEKLTTEVEELKRSVEFNNSLINVLKADNASLRLEVNELRDENTATTTEMRELQGEHNILSNAMLDLQCRSMKDNIIIHGVPEKDLESHLQTEQIVKAFLKDELKMGENEAEAIRFSEIHRIGRAKAGKNSRPIVAKVSEPRMKKSLMVRARELRTKSAGNTNYSITDQFPPEILRRRRLLYPVMKKARQENKKVRLFVDKLYIDGKLYEMPNV